MDTELPNRRAVFVSLRNEIARRAAALGILIAVTLMAVPSTGHSQARTQATPRTAQQTQARPSTDAAAQIATLWATAIDRNDIIGTYNAAGDLLKRNTTAQKWDNYLKDIRNKRGEVSVREWARMDRNVNPQGLPPGEYLTVYFLVNSSKTYGGADQVSLAYLNGRWARRDH